MGRDLIAAPCVTSDLIGGRGDKQYIKGNIYVTLKKKGRPDFLLATSSDMG